MSTKALEELVQHTENYIECWKQFNNFINLARAKKYTPEEENHFLEVKSVLIQELELILAAMEVGTPTKEDVHNLVAPRPPSVSLANRRKASSATSRPSGTVFTLAGTPSLASSKSSNKPKTANPPSPPSSAKSPRSNHPAHS